MYNREIKLAVKMLVENEILTCRGIECCYYLEGTDFIYCYQFHDWYHVFDADKKLNPVEVFDRCSIEIQTKLIFHLDLFNKLN